MTRSSSDRKKLLEHIQRLATDDDAVVDPKSTFLPLPSHALALRREAVVIEGTRGAGKTALFRLANTLGPNLSNFFDDEAIPSAHWIDAFSEEPQHPSSVVLDDLVKNGNVSDEDLRTFWLVHLLIRLQSEQIANLKLPSELARLLSKPTEPMTWLPKTQGQIGAAVSTLDGVERALASSRQLVFASYDYLDRIGLLDTSVRQRLIRSLLAMWLSLSTRYKFLRPKIFLRPDLFEDAESGFADASKLRPRSVSLEWDVESLYRLTARHLANAGPSVDLVRDWLTSDAKVRLTKLEDEFGWLPDPMSDSRQKSFATAFAGELMGKGARKGFTYRWIPARLKDAGGRIVPRSFLRLMAYAAKETLANMPNQGPLSEPKWLVAALQATSRDRVNELKEEYPFVSRLQNLKGETMLMDKRKVIAMLGKQREDQMSIDGESVFRELLRIGVLEVRPDGRIDVPDIYRYGYGIKRKGGAAAPR